MSKLDKIRKQLLDYNTELTNEDRYEISEYLESLPIDKARDELGKDLEEFLLKKGSPMSTAAIAPDKEPEHLTNELEKIYQRTNWRDVKQLVIYEAEIKQRLSELLSV